MSEEIDYKLLYLQERVTSLKQELAYLQSRFGQSQSELQEAVHNLNLYKNPPPEEQPIEEK